MVGGPEGSPLKARPPLKCYPWRAVLMGMTGSIARARLTLAMALAHLSRAATRSVRVAKADVALAVALGQGADATAEERRAA